MSSVFVLQPLPHPSRRNCKALIDSCPDGMMVTIKEPTRSLEQNALMWAVLSQLEKIDWYGSRLTKEEWKDVITASIKRQKVVPGIDGGFVVCGAKTSQMSIRDMAEVIECAYAFGAAHNVVFAERGEA